MLILCLFGLGIGLIIDGIMILTIYAWRLGLDLVFLYLLLNKYCTNICV